MTLDDGVRLPGIPRLDLTTTPTTTAPTSFLQSFHSSLHDISLAVFQLSEYL